MTFDLESSWKRWRWGLTVATAITLIGVYPIFLLPLIRGQDWKGSFPYLQGDEVMYAAYANALRDGHPRRNNPYTRDEDRPGNPLKESSCSVQFVPAYAIALGARAFRLSTSAAFAAVMVLVAFSSALLLFWLILSITGNEYLAAAGVLFVLCLGSIPTLWGLLQIVRGLPPDFTHLRFLQRYIPGMAFPFFLMFCALVWRILTQENRARAYSATILAGPVFVILVFSYFYFWTAAIAWIFLIGALWFIFRPTGWQRALKLLGVAGVLGMGVLPVYFWLLNNRSDSQDTALLLARTHAPDLFRVPQILCAVVLIGLVICSRFRLLNFRNQATLFAASFLLLPFLLFNQQIVTGLSLQPTHYEVYVANYGLLLSLVLLTGELSRNLKNGRRRYFNIGLIMAVIAALAWGTFEVSHTTKKFKAAFYKRDEATPAARRLAELAGSFSSDVVLVTDGTIADYLPTIAPQPVLWAPHILNFAGVTPTEERRRLLAFLYYTGIHFDVANGAQFQMLDADKKSYLSALLGKGRTDRGQSITWTPIAAHEYQSAQQTYSDFVTSFNRQTAAERPLTYVLTATDQPLDFVNLDRWYERSEGERLGGFTLYRVRLRP